MSSYEHRREFHLEIWLQCYAVYSYREIKAAFYLTNLLERVKGSYHFSLSLYHLSHASQCTVPHSNIHSASAEALKNFQPKKHVSSKQGLERKEGGALKTPELLSLISK
jgi:hypothetical protein